MPVFDVYSRRGCHLCEVLIEELLGIVENRASIEVHDIDSRPDWLEKYAVRIPVVEVSGAVLCEYRLDADAVRAALAVRA